MKALIKKSAVALMGFAACAAAEASKFDNCNKVAQLSESIMSARQKGVPAERAYMVFSKEENPTARDAYMALVTQAYEVPRFQTDENKRNAVSDFKDKTLVSCMR